MKKLLAVTCVLAAFSMPAFADRAHDMRPTDPAQNTAQTGISNDRAHDQRMLAGYGKAGGGMGGNPILAALFSPFKYILGYAYEW